MKGDYIGREADDIANLCFIGGKTNRQISDKPPVQYVSQIVQASGAAAFDAQCIPTDLALLAVEGFKAFLVRRRELIAERLNAFLNDTGSTERSPKPH